MPGCAHGNTPLQDNITNPPAQALSTNELPIVQLSELVHGPATPAPTANMQVSTSPYQTHGQRLVMHLGSTWITWPPLTSVPWLSMAPNYTQLVNSHTLPSVSMAEQFTMMSTSMTRSLISWATAKQGILPECYPEPVRHIHAMHTCHNISNPFPTADQNFHQCSMDKFVRCQGNSSTFL